MSMQALIQTIKSRNKTLLWNVMKGRRPYICKTLISHSKLHVHSHVINSKSVARILFYDLCTMLYCPMHIMCMWHACLCTMHNVDVTIDTHRHVGHVHDYIYIYSLSPKTLLPWYIECQVFRARASCCLTLLNHK